MPDAGPAPLNATAPRTPDDMRPHGDDDLPPWPETERPDDSASQADWSIKPSSLTREATDPLLGTLVAITRHYGRPRSATALLAGLPLVDNRLTPDLFTRAAERAGLSTRLTARPLSSIGDHLLPAVLLLKGRSACLMLERTASGVRVLLPETGMGETTIPEAELESLYSGHCFLVRPQVRFRDRASDPRVQGRGTWFWSTLKLFRGAYAQVAVAAFMVNLFALAGPMFTMNVYDRVVPNQAVETLWVLVIGIGTVYLFDFLLRVLRAYVVDHAGKRADVLMSARIFEQAMNVTLASRPGSAGAFASRLKEFESVRDFFTSATVTTLIDLPFIVLFLFVIFMIAGPVAFVPAAAVPIVVIGGFLLQWPLRSAVERSTEENTQKHSVLVEVISALDTVKSLGAEGRMQREWEQFCGASAKTGTQVKFLSGLGIHFSAFVQQIVTVGVVIAGVYLITLNELTVGGLIASTILTGRVMQPLGQVASLIARLHHARSARKSIDQLMALPVDRPEGAQYLARPDLQGGIEFNKVSFNYPDSQLPALSDISLFIKPGERVAIMGPVGSGKSTLARMILRLYDPTEGAILIDGTDIRQLDPADIRRAAGVVLQDTVLFRGTVRENIATSAPEADDSMILRAAALAGVHDFISRHPMGYDLPVGERGSQLSGGQRQAIALARALLPDPPLLVLDEPTSMMDVPAEQTLIRRLKDEMGDKTIILITHRPSLLALVDRIIVMGRGKIVADGPRDEILRAGQKKKPTVMPQPTATTTATATVPPPKAPVMARAAAPTSAAAPTPKPTPTKDATP